MNEMKTEILLNGLDIEVHPSGLTKCGEIQIDDCCNNAYIFCAFCPDAEDCDPKLYRTLQEFIDHIRWHRSDSFETPILSSNVSYVGFEGPEYDAQSDISAAAVIHETDYINDWIAPPEELFELNTINNFPEPETQPDGIISNDVGHDEVMEEHKSAHSSNAGLYSAQIENNPQLTEPSQADEDIPELTGEVFIELINLYKKCPCLWHDEIAATTNSNIINAAYQLLTNHFNNITQQSKPVEYVQRVVMKIKKCFLEEYKDPKQSKDSLPWYFPYLSFLLQCDSKKLDYSIFTDFRCPICAAENTFQEQLWTHLVLEHAQTTNNTTNSEPDANDIAIPSASDETLITEYPDEVVDKFIDLCRAQPCLWDKHSKGYFSPPLRKKSYDKLLSILREYDPNATRDEVVNRIKYLRSQFDESKTIIPLEIENSKPINKKQPIENAKMKKIHKPLPQLKVKPANFKKKIKSAKCPICSRPFNNDSTWLNHIELAHSSKDCQSADGYFYCTICGWQNDTKTRLMRHLRNRHTFNSHRCLECDSQFRLLSMLVEHRKKVHNDLNPFKCQICGEGFSTRIRLRTHSSSHLATLDKNRTEPSTTDLVGKEESIEKEHTPPKEDVITHKCDKCCKEFQSAQLLNAHINEVHVEIESTTQINNGTSETQKSSSKNRNRYCCHLCGAQFIRKTSLRKHKRLKHDKTQQN